MLYSIPAACVQNPFPGRESVFAGFRGEEASFSPPRTALRKFADIIKIRIILLTLMPSPITRGYVYFTFIS